MQNKQDRTFKSGLLWWVRGQDARATQRELGKLLDAPIPSRTFTALPEPTHAGTPQERVCWIKTDTLKPYFLFAPRFDLYSAEAAYEQAKAQSDGQYAPHTAFLQVRPAENWSIIDFLNEFGPLELFRDGVDEPRQQIEPKDLMVFGATDVPRMSCVWVDLEDFREKHRRFASIAKLWQAQESQNSLIAALGDVASLKVHPPIAPWYRDRHGYSLATALPWGTASFDEWVSRADETQILAGSAEIIKAELNLHTYEMRIRWTCLDPSRLSFRIVPSADSLWSAIWHLFARDTAEGLGWRVCPHCSKFFYPKRRDSYFCKPKYQKLHAANRWWKEHSEEELNKRRKKRATAAPNTKTRKLKRRN